jgi:hypothetical protein
MRRVRRFQASILIATILSTSCGNTTDWRIKSVAGMIAVRDAIFSTTSDNTSVFSESPEKLARRGFRWDDGSAIGYQPLLDDSTRSRIRSLPSALERAIQIADHIARGTNGCGGYDTDIALKYRWVVSGSGCCSDHTEIFLALAPEVSVIAREVETSGHAVVEVFDDGLSRWLLVDPTAAVIFEDSSARPLSILETRARIMADLPIRVRPFGTHVGASQAEADSVVTFYYGKPTAWKLSFASVALVWGSDVRSQSSTARTLHWLPLPARQLVAHVAGKRPPTFYLLDSISRSRLIRRSELRIAIACTLVLLAALVVLIATRLARRA